MFKHLVRKIEMDGAWILSFCEIPPATRK